MEQDCDYEEHLEMDRGSIYVGKWYVLAASTFLELLAGLGFTFSLYSSRLKDVLHLSQPQLQGLGTAMLCGGLFGIFPGLVYDRLYHKARLGPRLVTWIGILCHLVGYSILWATICQYIRPPYILLIINGLVLCNGPSWNDTVANVVNVQNFPSQRGPVAGIMKGFHGISASIMSSIFATCFDRNIPGFLLFVVIGPTLLAFIASILINRIPAPAKLQEASQGNRMIYISGALVLLYLYQASTALVQSFRDVSRTISLILVTGSTFLPILLIVAIPFGSEEPWTVKIRSRNRQLDGEEYLALEDQEGEEEQQLSQSNISAVTHKDGHRGKYTDSTLVQAIFSIDFWLLFSALFIGMGFGITVSNNLGQQVTSLGGSEHSRAISVLVFSTFHGLGCLTIGPISEILIRKFLIPRTAVLFWSSAGVAISSLLLAFSNLNILLPCVGFSGLVSGGFWPLFPSCTADLFGTRHFASIRGIMHISSSLGTGALSIGIAGTLYQHNLKQHGDLESICLGSDCFRQTYLIIAGLALIQTMLSWWLHMRRRKLWTSVQDMS